MNDIIYQSNAISQGFYTMSIYQKRLLMFGMSLLLDYYKELIENKKDETITEEDIFLFNKTIKQTKKKYLPEFEFRISDFLKIYNIKPNKQRYELVRNGIENLLDMKIVFSDSKTFVGYNWFTTCRFDENTDKVMIRFTPELNVAILNYKNAYSRLNLKTIGKLKTITACRFYEYALSYKNTAKQGVWIFSLPKDEIIKKFEIEGLIRNQATKFEQRIIKSSLEDINKNSDEIEMSYDKKLKSKKITDYIFTVRDKTYKTSKIEDTVFVPQKQETDVKKDEIPEEKKEILAEQHSIQLLIAEHSDQYIELYNAAFEKFSNFPDNMRKIFSEKEANCKLMELYS